MPHSPYSSAAVWLGACLLFCGSVMGHAQGDDDPPLTLQLAEAVALAQTESPGAAFAATRLSNREWQYKSALADFKPQVNLTGTLPQLNRSIQPITLPNGEQAFIPQALMTNEVGVSLSQVVGRLGGQVFVNSGLQRLDIFKQDNQAGRTSYLSTPISVGYQQNLSGYNPFRWQRELAPLRYEEAQLAFNEQREDLALQAAQRYFGVLSAQLNLEAARVRQVNADTLLGVSEGRYSVGRIAETELLQIELAALNAVTEVESARVRLRRDSEALRNLLGLPAGTTFALAAPVDLPALDVNLDTALHYARANRSEILGFRRRMLEAEEDYVRARADNGIQGDLFVRFGLAGSAGTVGDALTEPLDNQLLTLGLSVPIADFGKRRARLEVARSNRDLERLSIEQERTSLEQNVELLVRQFDLLRNNVGLAERAYEASERALDITRKRYLIGKIGITQLNLSIQEQDKARLLYLSALRDFWIGYYELRLNTLYDFGQGRSLR